MQVLEILAVPRNKRWCKRVGVWELVVEEVKRGRAYT